MVEEGKIKAYGASLDTNEEMQRFMTTTNGKVIEAFFNILHQDSKKAFELAIKNGVAIVVKIPLDSGWLSGKYSADSTFSDIRTRWTKEDKKVRANLVEKVKNIISNQNDLSQTAIAFCLAFDAVSTVIPGNKNIQQLKQNIQSLENPLSEGLVQKLVSFYKEEVEQLNLPW
jgi:aryl-alcohol dehydrogenase-like predicted oxidoreductase